MIVGGVYSFNNGLKVFENRFPQQKQEIYDVIESVDANSHKTKTSQEKTMRGKLLYSPSSLNKAFKTEFENRGWQKHKIKCDYQSQSYYTPTYLAKKRSITKGQFREMDFLKDDVGVEVQFGKYAFMVYNVCAKMTIFHNLGFINAGVEIVPLKEFADEMSSGVSYFEQIVWDLEHRGVADIDIPVLVLGVTA